MDVSSCPAHPRRTPVLAPPLAPPLVLLAAVVVVLLGLLAPASAAEASDRAADARTGAPAETPAGAAATYSAPLRTAVRDLPVASEVRTGYQRSLFPHWDDADGDGCNTREEVLLAEAEERPSQGSGCTLSGGRWFSYFDRVSVSGPSGISIDHMVPLAEAWDSGARSWPAADRRAFANDLGDPRSLVGVTTSVNSSKSDQDPAEWLPRHDVCRYVVDWTATKQRWRLTADSAERSRLISLADGCSNVTVSVTRAR